MCQSLEFVRTLIMTYYINMYINKYVMYATIRSTQIHTKGYGRTSCAFCDDRAVHIAMTELNRETLKDKQKEAICSFVNGRDCFVILPTGYGKTLCYVLLPYVFDHLRGKTRSSIVICVSPLISLMMDQAKKYSLLGLATQFVGQAQEDPSVTRGVLHGGYQLVFMSPEALIGCKHWQEMLLTKKYKDDLVALVVDEAHCVKT